MKQQGRAKAEVNIVPILQIGNQTLRRKAKPVPKEDIPTPPIRRVIRRMADTLRATEYGVAIAAPQIGKSLQIFLVLEQVYRPDDAPAETTGQKTSELKKNAAFMVFINPRITRHAKKKAEMEEGCLSVEGQYGRVARYEKVTVTALDEHGKPFSRGASGLFAQVIQHETDHLSGILFVDRATTLHPVQPAPAHT